MEILELRVPLREGGDVSGLLVRPADAQALLVLGHGAGAGMRHPFMADIATVLGLVFLGFPLHPAGQPGVERAAHLRDVTLPSLFVQGTRDRLAVLDLLRPVIDQLGERATLHVVEGGDHSFNVLRRSGRTGAGVLDEMGQAVAGWVTGRR